MTRAKHGDVLGKLPGLRTQPLPICMQPRGLSFPGPTAVGMNWGILVPLGASMPQPRPPLSAEALVLLGTLPAWPAVNEGTIGTRSN